MMHPAVTRETVPAESVRLTGCSVRGPKHERDETPCQDAWCGYELPDSRFVIAVGDGVGSAKHSDRGSRCATRTVADELKATVLSNDATAPTEMEAAMEAAFVAGRRCVEAEAREMGVSRSELHTTMLAVVGGPSGVAAAAVGDGGIVGHRDGEHALLVPREDTEYSNLTTPLTVDRWLDGYRFRSHSEVDAVAVFTDGLDPFAWSREDATEPRRQLFDQMFGFISSVSDADHADTELREFLDSEHFRKHKSDDKTMVVGQATEPDLETRIRLRWEDPVATSRTVDPS